MAAATTAMVSTKCLAYVNGNSNRLVESPLNSVTAAGMLLHVMLVPRFDGNGIAIRDRVGCVLSLVVINCSAPAFSASNDRHRLQ